MDLIFPKNSCNLFSEKVKKDNKSKRKENSTINLNFAKKNKVSTICSNLEIHQKSFKKMKKLKNYLAETDFVQRKAKLEEIAKETPNLLMNFILSDPKIKGVRSEEKLNFVNTEIICKDFNMQEKRSIELAHEMDLVINKLKEASKEVVQLKSEHEKSKKIKIKNWDEEENKKNIETNNQKGNEKSQIDSNQFLKVKENASMNRSVSSKFSMTNVQFQNKLEKSVNFQKMNKKLKQEVNRDGFEKKNIWYLDGVDGKRLAIKYGLIKKVDFKEENKILFHQPSITFLEKKKKEVEKVVVPIENKLLKLMKKPLCQTTFNFGSKHTIYSIK